MYDVFGSNENTCLFTGHRMIDKDIKDSLLCELYGSIASLYRSGYRNFIAGGAIGFDMLASAATISLRSELPDLRLTIALPCLEHDSAWPAQQRDELHALLSLSNNVVMISPGRYYNGCMIIRDKYMVERSSACIYYLDETRSLQSSGTAFTVGYAARHRLTMFSVT